MSHHHLAPYRTNILYSRDGDGPPNSRFFIVAAYPNGGSSYMMVGDNGDIMGARRQQSPTPFSLVDGRLVQFRNPAATLAVLKNANSANKYPWIYSWMTFPSTQFNYVTASMGPGPDYIITLTYDDRKNVYLDYTNNNILLVAGDAETSTRIPVTLKAVTQA